MLQKYQVQLLNTFWQSSVDEAIDALSKMIGKEVRLTKPSIGVKPITKIPELMNPEDITTTIVYTIVEDHANWTVVFSSSLKHFLRLIAILLKKEIDYYSALNEENESIVVELGNIINGYFVSSLNRLFETKLKYRQTEISVNPYRAIEDFDMGDIYKKNVRVLSFKSSFKVKNEDIEGKIFLLCQEKGIEPFLENITKNVKIVK